MLVIEFVDLKIEIYKDNIGSHDKYVTYSV